MSTDQFEASRASGLREGEIENAVLMGKNEWLFLWGGTNNVSGFYTAEDFFPQAKFAQWCQLIDDRAAQCDALGTRYLHMIAPDKLSVFPEYVTRPLPFLDQSPARRFARRFAGKGHFIDLLEALANHPDKESSYYKTDTHWTLAGANIAYVALCRRLGVAPVDFSARRVGGGETLFDLGSKLATRPKEQGRFCMLLRDAKRVVANELVRANEMPEPKGPAKLVGTYVSFVNETPAANPQKVMIFGDSYSEYRPYLLTGMLAETFAEVHFVWSSSMDFDLVKRIRPDILLSEVAERFVNLVPTDNYRTIRDTNADDVLT